MQLTLRLCTGILIQFMLMTLLIKMTKNVRMEWKNTTNGIKIFACEMKSKNMVKEVNVQT